MIQVCKFLQYSAMDGCRVLHLLQSRLTQSASAANSMKFGCSVETLFSVRNRFSRHALVTGILKNRANATSVSQIFQDKRSKSKSCEVECRSIKETQNAPAITDEVHRNNENSTERKPQVLRFFDRAGKRILRVFSSLPLAVGELFVIAGVLALGTLIEQGESPQYYFEKYPEESPALGIFNWRWILGLSLDHVYSSPIFLSLCLLLAVSLAACSTTTQLPRAKVARRWSFMKSRTAILKLDVVEELPRASIRDLGVLLMGAGYEVFLSGPSLYAFKGLAGRIAPIGVHAAILLTMAGATISSLGGFSGTITIPQGLDFTFGDALIPNGVLARSISAFSTEAHIDKFYIDYFENGVVKQYYTDLTLKDPSGKEILKRTISVNDPLRYGGITLYQTDWGIAAFQVHKDDTGPLNLVVATLRGGTEKLFGAFLPLEEDSGSSTPKGISILARDMQSVVLYDKEGNFVGVRRPGSERPIIINGVKIVVDEIIGSTGLEIKMDPGVPVVYSGFAGIMLSTVVSLFSHSQIWALQDDTTVIVGGKSNRIKLGFQSELNGILNSVPEILERSEKLKDATISDTSATRSC